MQLKTIKSGDKKLWCSNRYKRSVARTLNNIISIRAVKCSTSCFGVIFMQLRYCFQCAFQTSLASGGGRASSARIVPKTFSSGRKFFFSPFSPERKFVVRAPLVANFPFYELTYFLMSYLGSHSAPRRRKSMRRRVHDTQQELWARVRGELLGAHQMKNLSLRVKSHNFVHFIVLTTRLFGITRFSVSHPRMCRDKVS